MSHSPLITSDHDSMTESAAIPDEEFTAIADSLRSAMVVPPLHPQPMQPQTLVLGASWRQRFQRVCRFGGDAEPSSAGRRPPSRSAMKPGSHRAAGRRLLAAPVWLAALAATWEFANVISADGFGWSDYPLTALFGVLFLWVAFFFWTATLGFVSLLRRRAAGDARRTTSAAPDELPPTAVVMPVYNESPVAVLANLRSVARSLQATGAATSFDLFLLSDTTDAEIRLAEEHGWAELTRELPSAPRVFYRHRARNVSRKSGNIADFCNRWGGAYRYLVVLDADSVMAGETLVEMVRRMERDPELGILQVPPTPVNRRSLFARLQQFAARVYGPVLLEGFVLWSQCEGNYWGHNAIIRIKPFTDHCDLPVLPGNGPLSGEILSHDFVEAALMRRAGWKVCLAHDLDGSYEECPATLSAFAGRDRRWCQGNMQHLRLLWAEGLHPISRVHLSMGAMAYLSSALWLAFLTFTVLGAYLGDAAFADADIAARGGPLFALSMAMLLLPKLWGVIALRRSSSDQRPAGVADRVPAGVLLETLTSIFIAPIMMLLHTRFVIAALLGNRVRWDAQQRNDCRVSLGEAARAHWPQTLFGVGFAALTARLAPGLLPWLSPVLIGLIAAVPLAMLLGSVRIGEALARRRLLLIPEEIAPPPVLQWQQAAVRREAGRTAARDDLFESVLRDPDSYALHVGILRATGDEARLSPSDFAVVYDALADAGPRAVPPALRSAVLDDSAALAKLHGVVHNRAPGRNGACLTNGNGQARR